MYEVEQKFVVADLDAVQQRLVELGVEYFRQRSEIDTYFNHPARDFAETDEAIRLRQVGGENRITYKGPKIDKTTKTRHEIDLKLLEGEETFYQWAALLKVLGFEPVGQVQKEREKAWLDWEGYHVEVSLDTVAELGTFVELEIIAPENQVDAARDAIGSLAKTLGLTKNERRSYLGLLLGKMS
ncbi:MAG: class IV adenylate cyclase [Planctomycetia bacterium]|jgi:adenylate cyclase class 2